MSQTTKVERLRRNPGDPHSGLASQQRRSCSGFDHPCSVTITFDHLLITSASPSIRQAANEPIALLIHFDFALYLLNFTRTSAMDQGLVERDQG